MLREKILPALKEALSAVPDDLIAAYLFGSVSRGTAGPGSDVDVGLLYRREPERKLMSPPRLLEGDLERILGHPVEVVVLNSAPPDLVHRVLRDGVLALDRDRSARIQFEVRSRNEYFDMLPILDEYRRAGRRQA